MTAACSVGINEPLSIESPVVRGRASASGCPGCQDQTCAGRFGCVWASHVVKNSRLANAVDWHRDLCGKLAAITDASTRANHIRVVCLLAIVIQAAASEELFSWLIENLRPMNDDRTHPLWESTRGFGQRFANAIPAPPDPKQENNKTANGGGDDMFSSSWFAIPADGGAKAAWADRLTELMMRLQTNLFYLQDDCIGIFKVACQLEHACRPNASVLSEGKESLIVRSLRPIDKGERVSFCYLSEYPALADHMPLSKRRPLMVQQLGFECCCEACTLEAMGVKQM